MQLEIPSLLETTATQRARNKINKKQLLKPHPNQLRLKESRPMRSHKIIRRRAKNLRSSSKRKSLRLCWNNLTHRREKLSRKDRKRRRKRNQKKWKKTRERTRRKYNNLNNLLKQQNSSRSTSNSFLDVDKLLNKWWERRQKHPRLPLKRQVKRVLSMPLRKPSSKDRLKIKLKKCM